MKTVLVTGSSSGFGFYIVRRLAANGFYVYAGVRKKKDLNKFKGIDNVQTIKLDVTVQDEIDDAATFIESQERGLFGIVNNAGVTTFARMDETSEEEMRRVFDVNVFGPYRINKTFSPMLIASGGRTITIGSISGYIARAENGVYAMSKFALEGYTDSYSQEMDEVGVHVSIVEPGGYKSRILHNVSKELLSDELKQRLDKAIERHAKGRKEPFDVSSTVLHILTTDTPKRRYLVMPDKIKEERILQRIAEITHEKFTELKD